MHGRIWFPGNPWPDGHRIAEFSWTGRLDATGRLWFDFDLLTADYYEENDPPDKDGDHPDWATPIAWGNFHRCRISSTYWADEADGEAGLLAGVPGKPFRLHSSTRQVLRADPLPVRDPEELAFFMYLLGHDQVADHSVTFTRCPDGTHHIDWGGRIALTYVGQEEFAYQFRAELDAVTLGPISYPETTPAGQARQQLEAVLDAAADFTISPLVPHALLPKL